MVDLQRFSGGAGGRPGSSRAGDGGAASSEGGVPVQAEPAEVEQIDRRMIQLFALVGEAIAGSTAVLLTGDREAARALVARDAEIDARYRELDRTVLGVLAAGAPPAAMSHLVTVLRILPEVERSGDLAEHVARRASEGITTETSARARGLIERMGDVACAMWRMAADAYGEGRPDVGEELDSLDDELDELHVSLTAELVGGGMPIAVIIELVLIARFYERLGDHAVNIARRVSERIVPAPFRRGAAGGPRQSMPPAPTTTRSA